MATSLTHFKWTDDKLVNVIKRLQEYQSSYEKFWFLKFDGFNGCKDLK